MLKRMWKPINIPELSHYRISNTGAVMSPKGKILKNQVHHTGYLMVSIEKRLYFNHKLVAITYLPNPLGMERVLHFDGAKVNNHVDNLFYADANSFRDLQIRYLYRCGNEVDRIAKVFELGRLRVYQIVKNQPSIEDGEAPTNSRP